MVITKKLDDVQMKTVQREKITVPNPLLFHTMTFKDFFFLKIEQLYFLVNADDCQNIFIL